MAEYIEREVLLKAVSKVGGKSTQWVGYAGGCQLGGKPACR